MTKILAFDTAMSACSAALLNGDNGVCTAMSEAMARGQAERLVPMVGEVLATADCPWKSVGLVAVTVGPGAFTGLRIGLSAARAFALSLGVPLAGFTTLEVIAQAGVQRGAFAEGRTLCVVLETKRADYYAQIFDNAGRSLSEPFADGAQEILARCDKDTQFAGDAASRFLKESGLPPERAVAGLEAADPEILARMAWTSLKTGVPFSKAEPVYLRGADVSKPKKEQRLLRLPSG